VLEEIINEYGGVRHPLGSERMKPYEFCLLSRAIITLGS